jgi:hypothetical protein
MLARRIVEALAVELSLATATGSARVFFYYGSGARLSGEGA